MKMEWTGGGRACSYRPRLGCSPLRPSGSTTYRVSSRRPGRGAGEGSLRMSFLLRRSRVRCPGGHAPSTLRMPVGASRPGSQRACCSAPTDPERSGLLRKMLPSVLAWATPAWAAVEACTGMTCQRPGAPRPADPSLGAGTALCIPEVPLLEALECTKMALFLEDWRTALSLPAAEGLILSWAGPRPSQ